MFCFLGLAYATFVSLCSMSMFWWIDLKPGLEWLAALFALLWIGFGMAGVTWTKAWMNKPSFGTGMSTRRSPDDSCLLTPTVACSMTVIVLFVV